MRLVEQRWPVAPSPRELDLVSDVLRSRVWTDGVWTAEVERRMCDITEAPHAVAFNSCTSALHAALHGMGCSPATRLAVPALTFAGTATGARHIGVDFRFTDVRPDTLNLVEDLPEADLVLAVDLHGVPHGLDRGGVGRDGGTRIPVLTDACQSLGTRMGGAHIGHRGTHAWSFSSAKLVPAPDGGAVTTDDPALADRLRELRDYGVPLGVHRSNGAVVRPGGHNWRPTESTMAIVCERLNDMPGWVSRAGEVTARLHATMDELGLWRQRAPEGAATAWHKIRFGTHDRSPESAHRLECALTDAGVPTHRWGLTPLHQHDAFRPSSQPTLPTTESMATTTLCLGTETCPPMTWTDDETEEVCRILDKVAGSNTIVES